MEKLEVPKRFEGRDVVTLNDWETRFSNEDNWFLAPEANSVCLSGVVKNHPRKEDGKRVKTSPIQDSDGRFVLTQNNLYLLGDPSEGFLDWMKSRNYDFDPERPIKKIEDPGNTLDGISR